MGKSFLTLFSDSLVKQKRRISTVMKTSRSSEKRSHKSRMLGGRLYFPCPRETPVTVLGLRPLAYYQIPEKMSQNNRGPGKRYYKRTERELEH